MDFLAVALIASHSDCVTLIVAPTVILLLYGGLCGKYAILTGNIHSSGRLRSPPLINNLSPGPCTSSWSFGWAGINQAVTIWCGASASEDQKRGNALPQAPPLPR